MSLRRAYWRALQAAGAYHRGLLRLQRRAMGPRGFLRRYQRRWQAEVGYWLGRDPQRALDAHDRLSREVLDAVRGLWDDAAQVGRAVAERQVRAYDLALSPDPGWQVEGQRRNEAATRAVVARLALTRQQLLTLADLVEDAREAEQRVNNMSGPWAVRHDLAVHLPGVASSWLALGLVGALLVQWTPNWRRRIEPLPWKKQAVATVDRHTTPTCLNVHGQVVALNKPFHLTGEPRFADHIQWPPFHWHCRTSVVLYHPDLDAGYTQRMLQAAAEEWARRAAGGGGGQPAGAFGPE